MCEGRANDKGTGRSIVKRSVNKITDTAGTGEGTARPIRGLKKGLTLRNYRVGAKAKMMLIAINKNGLMIMNGNLVIKSTLQVE